MQLTQKIRIDVTPQQEEALLHLSEKCRLIYNFALTERKQEYKYGRKVSYIDQQNKLPEIKRQYPEYKQVYSKVLQHTLRTLDANYKSFFALRKHGDKDANTPKYRGKKYFTTMTYNQSGFKLHNNYMTLSQNYNDTDLSFKLPDKFSFNKIKQVSIFKQNDSYYLSILHETIEPEYKDNNLYQAFDLGITKHTAVNTNGRFIEFTNQRPDLYWKKPIATVQSQRDHCKKYTTKWRRINKILNKLIRKKSNQLKDAQHKLSRQIVDHTKANTIIVGQLDVKKMSKKRGKYKRGLNRAVTNTGFLGRFVGFLTYKARNKGKRIIEINERGTSKTCCICGSKQDMPLYKRQYICDCGNNIDRDKNSSVNIMCRFLSTNAMWTGYQHFAGNLRQTGLPISGMHSQEAPFSNPKEGFR